MINLQIDDVFSEEGLESGVITAAEVTLQLEQKGPTEFDLAIVITGDEQVRRLNRKFRGINAATDVLSFPNDEDDPDTNRRNLGDIIISYPRAVEQALARQGSPLSEIQLLVVHGILHLLGYDHADADQKQQMWSTQLKALKELNLETINPA